VKFFRPEHSGKLAVGDKIIKLELTGHTTCILSWKLYRSVQGNLVWAYASFDDIHFNNKIEGNQVLAMKLEEEHNELATDF